MSLYSFVKARFEDGPTGGVPRFDAMIRKAFPEIRSVTKSIKWTSRDVVITDNGMSLLVPPETPTIVVHHGSAHTHYDRDKGWQTKANLRMVHDQELMFNIPNRIYVAPSAWVREQFATWLKLPETYAEILPHWVEMIGHFYSAPGRMPLIIGDFRSANKGADVWPVVQKELGNAAMIQKLAFRGDGERRSIYGSADIYLCLSLSEGAPYSVADAEAAGLTIISTPVGNWREFPDMRIISMAERERPDMIAQSIMDAIARPRTAPSYYSTFTFNNWRDRWTDVIARARQGAEAWIK